MASLTHNGALALKERTHGASTGVISSTMIKRLGIIFIELNKVCILWRDYPTKCVSYRETTQQSVYSIERQPNTVCILWRDYPTKCVFYRETTQQIYVFYRETTQQSVYSIEKLPNKVCIL